MTIDALRPSTLDDFGGQDPLVRELRIILASATARKDLSDHLLLAGPPGLGKTTLASIIASELGIDFVSTAGPSLERPASVISVLSSLTGPSVVFIDEIHRLPVLVEETLYPAMEDGVLDVLVGEGARARPVRIPLKPFVLVGATTQSGLLSAPLRDRFGFHGKLTLYNEEALTAIVLRSAKLLELNVDTDAAAVVASRARGTPRVANAWLRRVRDYAASETIDIVDSTVATAALEAFHIDALGLDQTGRDILAVIIEQFDGGPVGLNTVAASVGETSTTIEEVYEPFLMRSGLLARTPRGRIATARAYEHLGRNVATAAPALFDGIDEI